MRHVVKSKVGKSFAKIAIENAPEVYKKGIGKVKKLQKTVNTDFANTSLDYGRAYTYDKLNSTTSIIVIIIVNICMESVGIFNLEIRKFIKMLAMLNFMLILLVFLCLIKSIAS